MFAGANARRIDVVKMCEDCRVEAAVSESFDPHAVPRPPTMTTEDYLRTREVSKGDPIRLSQTPSSALQQGRQGICVPGTETTARAAFGSEGPSLYVPARFKRRPQPSTASLLDYAPHSPSELRYNLLFKPRLSLHPDSASPTRMWKWKELRNIREMLLPSPSSSSSDLIPDNAFGNIDQVTASLRIRQVIKYAPVPEGSAFRTRRLITAVRRRAGVTKTNGQDRDFSLVVENRAVQIRPIPEAVAACVVPRDTGLMGLAAWRLTDDH